MIDLKDLRFSYGDHDFTLVVPQLHIASGEKVAIIGSSGCGKTTLLDLISGVLLPSTGEVRVHGVPISSLKQSERQAHRVQQMGLVFQSFELVEYVNVLDNILLPAYISPALSLSGALRKRATALAEAVGLGRKTKRNIAQLSQGERQRVAICRALIAEPQVLLCDEPTGNLDPLTSSSTLDCLWEHGANSTIVVVTHDHDQLKRFDRVIRLPLEGDGQ